MITKKIYNCLLDNDFLVADAGKENGREYGELYSWIGEMDFKGRHYDLEVDFMVSFDSDESLIRFVEQNYTTKKSHYEAVKSYDSEGNGNHIADMPDAEAMFKAMPEYSVKEMPTTISQRHLQKSGAETDLSQKGQKGKRNECLSIQRVQR